MFTDLVTGDVPGAATYFNPLMRQTTIPCTSGTRPSSPHEGMHAYETDTDRLVKWNGSAWEYVAGTRTTFTPTLTASSSGPTMGTSPVRNGWYVYLPGPSIHYEFFIRFGTGAAAGSGSYSVSLPVTSANVYASSFTALGPVLMADASSSGFRVGSCFVPAGASTVVSFVSEGGAVVTNAAPWTWADSDYISGSLTYPI